jgi:hypothetical protein
MLVWRDEVQMARYFVGESSRGLRGAVGSGTPLVLKKNPFKFLRRLHSLAHVFEWEVDAADALSLSEDEREKRGVVRASFGSQVALGVNRRWKRARRKLSVPI